MSSLSRVLHVQMEFLSKRETFCSCPKSENIKNCLTVYRHYNLTRTIERSLFCDSSRRGSRTVTFKNEKIRWSESKFKDF